MVETTCDSGANNPSPLSADGPLWDIVRLNTRQLWSCQVFAHGSTIPACAYRGANRRMINSAPERRQAGRVDRSAGDGRLPYLIALRRAHSTGWANRMWIDRRPWSNWWSAANRSHATPQRSFAIPRPMPPGPLAKRTRSHGTGIRRHTCWFVPIGFASNGMLHCLG